MVLGLGLLAQAPLEGLEQGEELLAKRLAGHGVQEEVDRVIQVLESEKDAAHNEHDARLVDEVGLLDRLQGDDGHRGEKERHGHDEEHDGEASIGRRRVRVSAAFGVRLALGLVAAAASLRVELSG